MVETEADGGISPLFADVLSSAKLSPRHCHLLINPGYRPFLCGVRPIPRQWQFLGVDNRTAGVFADQGVTR